MGLDMYLEGSFSRRAYVRPTDQDYTDMREGKEVTVKKSQACFIKFGDCVIQTFLQSYVFGLYFEILVCIIWIILISKVHFFNNKNNNSQL